MDGDLAHQAIQAALKGEWRVAENLNRRILEVNTQDIDALLRLANARAQLGKIKEAQTVYKKILKLEPHNLFAVRSLDRLKKVKRGTNILHPLTNSFLEEPGKTKTVTLVYTAPTRVIVSLDAGEPVNLVARPHRISVATATAGVYVGRLPDYLSARLLGFIKGGNEYEAAIKSVAGNTVKVFIRETLRCPKFATTPSFPSDLPAAQGFGRRGDFSASHEV